MPDGNDVQRIARRNLATLFTVSIFLGVGVAVYEVALPLYLKRVGFSWMDMGWVYGAGAVITFGIRVGMGAWSDRVGRKLVYMFSLLWSGLATLLTPFFANVYAQAVLRSVAEPMARVREAMHSVLLYEDSPETFLNVFGRTRGIEFLFHFLGLIGAGACMHWLAGRGVDSPEVWVIVAAAGMLMLSGGLFGALFHERKLRESDRAAISWRDVLKPRLSRPMWVMTASMFAFTTSIMVSHCFALQLFFKEKYGASNADIFTIGALHRLSCAAPMLLLSHLFKRNQKFWLMLFLGLEGVFVALPGFMPAAGTYTIAGVGVSALWATVIVWLFHDILGMGIWLPMQQSLLQRYSRPESRGKDVSLASALSTIGAISSPFIAGWLRDWPGLADGATVNLPFIISGIGVTLSALILFALPKEREGVPQDRPDGY